MRPHSVLLAVALLFAGCKEEPVEIKIKGPKEAVESSRSVPVFAPFENKNDTIQLRASAFDKRKRYMGTIKAKWTSSDRGVATVNQSGLVTFLSSGKAKITAETMEYENNLEASIEFEAKIVKDIRIVEPSAEDQKNISMPLGETKMFKAEVLNDRGAVMPDAKVEWRATSFAVTITPQGEVEARAIGQAQVVAEAKNGSVARVDVTVTDWAKKKRKRRRR